MYTSFFVSTRFFFFTLILAIATLLHRLMIFLPHIDVREKYKAGTIMDVRETVPCVVDGLSSSGRVSSAAGVTSRTSSMTIAKPQVRNHSEWSSTVDVEAFSLPSTRICAPTENHESLRYIADATDEYWVAITAASAAAAASSTSRGGKVGHSPAARVVSAVADLSVSFLEDVFTLLEFAAAEKPDITSDRIKLTLDVGPPQLVEQVREYWLSKRRACGGVPLLNHLWLTLSDDSNYCNSEVLGDCPVPFVARDGHMHAVVLTEKKSTLKRDREEAVSRFCESSMRVAAAVAHRTQCELDHTLITLHELALLRHSLHGKV